MADETPQALFLDRDGTLIKWVDYLHKPEEVELLPGVTEALRIAKNTGCLLFIHTNQSGVGRGYFEMDAVRRVNDRMFELMGIEESFFDGICIAPDHPNQLLSPSYRKPSPLFEMEMVKNHNLDLSMCFFLGDNLCDVETGVAAEMQSIGIGEEPIDGCSMFPSVLKFVSTYFGSV